MRKILLSILNVLFICFCFAQKGDPNEHPPIIRPGIISVNCIDISPPNCNYIRNNNFAHPNYTPADFGDPFGLGKVPEWYPASGTPQINESPLNDPAPVGVTGYFFGAVDTYFDINSQTIMHNYEGIVQKIPKLIPGHTYAMSFLSQKKIMQIIFQLTDLKYVLLIVRNIIAHLIQIPVIFLLFLQTTNWYIAKQFLII